MLELTNAASPAPEGAPATPAPPPHVLAAVGETDGTTIRFSFSKYNNSADIDTTVESPADILRA